MEEINMEERKVHRNFSNRPAPPAYGPAPAGGVQIGAKTLAQKQAEQLEAVLNSKQTETPIETGGARSRETVADPRMSR